MAPLLQLHRPSGAPMATSLNALDSGTERIGDWGGAGVAVLRKSLHEPPVGARATVQHYLRDLVYGASDGIITTFAVTAGVAGGSLSQRVALIIGVANLLGDGFSMAVGNYLSIRAHEGVRRARNLPEEESEPIRHASATFLAFVIAGALPLIPYVVNGIQERQFVTGIALTLTALVMVGLLRASVTDESWWRGVFEMVGLGVVVALVAYASGMIIVRLSTSE